MSKLNFLIEKYLIVESKYKEIATEYSKVVTAEWTEVDDDLCDMEEVMKSIESKIYEIKPEWKELREFAPYEENSVFFDKNREYDLETLQFAYKNLNQKMN